jgi:hypothetical protein
LEKEFLEVFISLVLIDGQKLFSCCFLLMESPFFLSSLFSLSSFGRFQGIKELDNKGEAIFHSLFSLSFGLLLHLLNLFWPVGRDKGCYARRNQLLKVDPKG